MSSMLEQAIVDARALKEAAIKNAEAAIIEKYSQEMKTTVDTILNEYSEDTEYAAMEAPAPQADPSSGEEPSGAGMLELDLGGLMDLARASAEEGIDAEEMLTHDDMAEEMQAAEDMAEPDAQAGNIDEEVDLANLFETDEETEDGIEISEQELKDIVEKLTLDFHPEKTGWLEKPQFETRQAELEAEALAAHDDSDDGEMDKLVEAISNSKTVEETKVIYETLQGAVGGQRKQIHAPKSLSEAVTRRSSALLKGSEAKPTRDPNMDRMKRLAGIN